MNVRFTSSRSGYSRGGLVFNDQTCRRIADGRLVMILGPERLERLSAADVRDLITDPHVQVEPVGDDGLTEAERRTGKPANAKPQHDAPKPIESEPVEPDLDAPEPIEPGLVEPDLDAPERAAPKKGAPKKATP